VLEVKRVRSLEVALIERVSALGRLEAPKIFASKRDEMTWVMQHCLGTTLGRRTPKFADDTMPPMLEHEPQRTAEAVRRALPALLCLHRYEVRAVAKRDTAVLSLIVFFNNPTIDLARVLFWQNEPNFSSLPQRFGSRLMPCKRNFLSYRLRAIGAGEPPSSSK
jgi:hypothetical protein